MQFKSLMGGDKAAAEPGGPSADAAEPLPRGQRGLQSMVDLRGVSAGISTWG